MNDGHYGHFEADHRAQLGAIRPGGVDNILGNDASLLGYDLPSLVGKLIHIQHPVVPGDLGSELAGAGGHRVGRGAGIGPPVPRRVEAKSNIVNIEQRVQGGYLVAADEVRLHSDQLQDSVDVLEPIHLVWGASQTDRTAAVPPGVEAGLLLEPRVQVRRISMDLGGVETADEVRD